MDREQINQLYDASYAASYEEKFTVSPSSKGDTEHELGLIRQLLLPEGNWLDIACGTGYFLGQFPQVQRAGLDISEAMLAKARMANPGIPLYLQDFRDPQPAWKNRWDLVSCMWYAYGFVNTMDELQQLVHNIWSWTSPRGRCFIPLADPRLIAGVPLPHVAPTPWDGQVVVSGILWSYVEDGGRKSHLHMLAPHVEVMAALFEPYFEQVEIVRYPSPQPDWPGRPALVTSGKKSLPRWRSGI